MIFGLLGQRFGASLAARTVSLRSFGSCYCALALFVLALALVHLVSYLHALFPRFLLAGLRRRLDFRGLVTGTLLGFALRYQLKSRCCLQQRAPCGVCGLLALPNYSPDPWGQPRRATVPSRVAERGFSPLEASMLRLCSGGNACQYSLQTRL